MSARKAKYQNRLPRYLVTGSTALVICLFALSSSAATVKILVPSNGSGVTSDATHQVRLTIGQSLIGTTSDAPSGVRANFGIWYLLNQTYVVSPAGGELPVARNALGRSYPNPFNPSTHLNFSLAQASEVRIDVYDLKGRRVATLLQEVRPPGEYSVVYEPKNLPSGVYLVLMRAGDFRATQRIMLVK